MSSKRRSSQSPTPDQQSDTDTNATQSINLQKPNTCLICGDKARIINYGALSCQSCKTFFRRNGFRPETVRPCLFNQSCEVNMQTRHNCTACRLAKCFSVGMNSNLIRKEDKKVKISTSTELDNDKQIKTAPQQSTVNLVQDNRNLLADSEWTLLSNILSSYDTYSTAPQVYQTTDDLSKLSVESHLNIINPLEIISQLFISMRSFISSSPHFRILTINEQISLVERNLHGIIGMYSTLFFRNTNILHNVQYIEAFTNIYGSNIISSIKNLDNRLDSDLTIIKLILIVLAFSSNCFNINKYDKIERDSLLYGTFRLLGSQNVYLELLWKYMIYRYGYNESIIRYSRLIQIYLCISKNVENIYTNNQAHHNMVDCTIEKIKQSLILNDHEQTSLWGKI